MSIYCPACDASHPDPSPSDTTANCRKCGVETHIDGRFVLVASAPSASGEDVVDRASASRQGRDTQTGDAVTIRIATIGNEARLEREATVLKGLRMPCVPRVSYLGRLDGVGMVLVLTAPPFPTLQEQVEEGLRIDDDRARVLIEAMLNGLRELHRLSPPVHHRNIHPNTVAWDGAKRIFFLDFARATDTVHDAQSDLVAARPGYAPNEAVSAAQQDLYGLSATVAHVLSRRNIAELPKTKRGAPDIRPNIVVSNHVEQFLETLLTPSASDSPRDVEEALTLWRATPGPVVMPVTTRGRAKPPLAVVAAGVSLVVMVGLLAAGYFLAFSEAGTSSPMPVGTLGAKPKVITTSPPPQQAPPVSVVTTTKSADTTAPSVPQVPKIRRKRRANRAPTPPSPASLFRTKLNAQKDALMACDDPANNRIRMTVQLGDDGRVSKISEVGRSRGSSAACVRGILNRLTVPANLVSKKVDLDVWVWTHPSFKTKVF